MANLKLDLVNRLNNDKYYEELELVRLAQEPNMCYKEKIDLMVMSLDRLAILNAQIGLAGQYFQEPPVQQAQVTPQSEPQGQAPQSKVHQGQTHGE